MFSFDFENKKTETHGVHYSRYIASWIHELRYPEKHAFKEWLKSLNLNDDEVKDIYDMYTNGKLELQASANDFLYGSGDE